MPVDESRHNALEIQMAVLQNEFKNLKESISDLELIDSAQSRRLTDIESRIENSINGIKELLNETYVSKIEWQPIKLIIYGLVGIILIGTIGALLSLVMIKKN